MPAPPCLPPCEVTRPKVPPQLYAFKKSKADR
jgi:hypothetical protein